MRTLRWVLSSALSIALVASPTPAGASTGTFSDVDGTPYEEAVEALAAEGIVAGCDDADRYCPGDPVRRDQAAALLARAFDLPPAERDHFDDDDGNAHEDAINRLAAARVSLGCAGAASYCADQTLRRGQMAALLVRAGGIERTSDRYFRDTGATHRDAINRLAAAGISSGCGTRPARFCPGNHVLRGELALFLARALELHPRTDLGPLPAARSKVLDKRTQRKRSTVWDRLAACESGRNWSVNSGNGYYGGLQFSLPSWRAVGGSGYPHNASRAEQIKRGKRLKARQGWGAWPSCSSKLGLR